MVTAGVGDRRIGFAGGLRQIERLRAEDEVRGGIALEQGRRRVGKKHYGGLTERMQRRQRRFVMPGAAAQIAENALSRELRPSRRIADAGVRQIAPVTRRAAIGVMIEFGKTEQRVLGDVEQLCHCIERCLAEAPEYGIDAGQRLVFQSVELARR